MAATAITATAVTAAADGRVGRPRPGSARAWRIGVALVLAAGGAWLAIQLAQRDADIGAPEGADRLLRTIDADPAVSDADVARAHRMLGERPNDGRAFRVLAQAADARGDTDEATRLYGIAVRLAPRDRLTRAALADRAFARGDLATAMKHVDALLRVAPATRATLLPQLAGMLDRADVRAALIPHVQASPNWRSALVGALLTKVTPAAGAEAFLAELSREHPLTSSEINARVTLLQRLGRTADARTVWQATLPTAQRALAVPALFDGGFEAPEVTGGFAWHITPQSGVSVLPDGTEPAEGQGSLSLVFEGRAVTGLGVEQLLALTPGRYRLTGKADNATTVTRPFVLQVACTTGGVAGSVELPGPQRGPGWQAFAGAVDVPPACTGQRLQLRYLGRSLHERIISGNLRLDALDLRSE